MPAGRGLRITTRPTPEGVSLSGLDRLKPLEPLLRFARSLRAYAAPHDPQGATGVWELELDDARLVLALSPESSRGFSGEGGVLWDLADEQSADDADLVSALLAFEPRIDVARLAAESGLPEERVTRALGRLGAAGRVGYDAAEAAYFHRELPYDAERLATMHPRLRDAQALVEADAVRLDGDTAHVRSGDTDHVVRRTETAIDAPARGSPSTRGVAARASTCWQRTWCGGARDEPGRPRRRAGERRPRPSVRTCSSASRTATARRSGQKARALAHARAPPTRVSPHPQALAVLATAGGVRQAAWSLPHPPTGWDLTRSSTTPSRSCRPATPRGCGDLVDSPAGRRRQPGTGGSRADSSVRERCPSRTTRSTSAGPCPRRAGLLHPGPGAARRAARDADPGLVGDHLLAHALDRGSGRLLAYHDGVQESIPATTDRPTATTPFPPGPGAVALRMPCGRADASTGSRLLDAVLAAPLRDWAAADLGWYVGMHDALGADLDEVAERQDTYTRLLTVEHGPSVKTAQRELLRLLTGPPVRPDPFLEASHVTLGRSDKASVAAQLRLLEKLARAYPTRSRRRHRADREDHARADIREQAAKMLARLGADLLRPTETGRLPAVPAPEAATSRRPPSSPSTRPTSWPRCCSADRGGRPPGDGAGDRRPLRFADERPPRPTCCMARATEASTTRTIHGSQPDPRPGLADAPQAFPRRRVADRLGPHDLPCRWRRSRDLRGCDRSAAHRGRPRRPAGEAAPRSRCRPGRTSPSTPTSSAAGSETVGRSRPVLELELVVALLRVPAAERAAVEVPRSLARSPAAVRRPRAGAPPSLARRGRVIPAQ